MTAASTPSQNACHSLRSLLMADIAPTLLAWYDRHARKLPWRVSPKDRARGVMPDTYRVWLSEVMLQQTTVAAVKPYFDDFVARWPTVAALARAPREDVLKAWAGLGYYARARNLHACARVVSERDGGRFPETSAELRTLPGVGEYTAAAIAAIAFDEPAPVVEANIERVLARFFAVEEPLPAAKKAIREAQAAVTPQVRAGDYAQAMMDLGAAICTPKKPACVLCPIAEPCIARATGRQEDYPVKAPRTERPTRCGAAFVAVRPDGAVLLRTRADHGLLGGMTEVPGSAWSTGPALEATPPFAAMWRRVPGTVVHVFTHFRLELAVFRADVAMSLKPIPETRWAPAQSIPGEALPSVMKKAIEAAVPGVTLKRVA
jgi:A/G-specific adenine glycosylase